MTESNEEAQLKAAIREAFAAMNAYQADVAQEQVHAGKAQASRDSAIANAIRCGAALNIGRAIHATDDNTFHGWVKHTGSDQMPPFDERRERSAAMQMARIAGDGTTVTPFAGCPYSRPTNCMKWFALNRRRPSSPSGRRSASVRSSQGHRARRDTQVAEAGVARPGRPQPRLAGTDAGLRRQDRRAPAREVRRPGEGPDAQDHQRARQL